MDPTWSQDILRNQPYPRQVWGPAGKLPFTTFGNELIDFAENAKNSTGIPFLAAIMPPSQPVDISYAFPSTQPTMTPSVPSNPVTPARPAQPRPTQAAPSLPPTQIVNLPGGLRGVRGIYGHF
jgi:hypothetical protein